MTTLGDILKSIEAIDGAYKFGVKQIGNGFNDAETYKISFCVDVFPAPDEEKEHVGYDD